MFLDKKGVHMNLVMMIFSVITLIFLISFIVSITNDSTSSFESAECSLLFTEGVESGAFYSGDLRNFNERFFKYAETNCNSFELKVNKENQNKGIDLIEACYNLIGSGNIFLPKEMNGEGICYYCGNIELDDISFEEFHMSIKENFEDYKNLNIKNSDVIDLGEEIGIFTFQYRESFSEIDEIGSFIDSNIADFGGFFGKEIDLFSNDANVYTGFAFAQKRIEQVDGEIINQLYINDEKFNDVLNCKTIVPLKK